MTAKKLCGATLIELIIGMGIFVTLIGLTLPFAMQGILRTQSVADHSAAIAQLRSARDQAIANINGVSTGFYIDTDNYVVFYGDSYQLRDQDKDIKYSRTHSLLPTGLEVRFAATTGLPTIISNNQSQTSYTHTTTEPGQNRVLELSINQEGLIDWQE